MERLQAIINAPVSFSMETVRARIGNLSGALHDRLIMKSELNRNLDGPWGEEEWGPDLMRLFQRSYELMLETLLCVGRGQSEPLVMHLRTGIASMKSLQEKRMVDLSPSIRPQLKIMNESAETDEPDGPASSADFAEPAV